MATEPTETLPQDIATYTQKAVAAATDKHNIVERIGQVMVPEIPNIEAFFVPGYSLSKKPEDVRVAFLATLPNWYVPEAAVDFLAGHLLRPGFEVRLRMLKDNKPIFVGTNHHDDMNQNRQASGQYCKDLAVKYGLAGIVMEGEPVEM